jgi:hypothetical protein
MPDLKTNVPPHIAAEYKADIEKRLGHSLDSDEGQRAFMTSIVFTLMVRNGLTVTQKADVFRAFCRHIHNDGKWQFVSSVLDTLNEPGHEDFVRSNSTLTAALLKLADSTGDSCVTTHRQLTNLVEAFGDELVGAMKP